MLEPRTAKFKVDDSVIGGTWDEPIVGWITEVLPRGKRFLYHVSWNSQEKNVEGWSNLMPQYHLRKITNERYWKIRDKWDTENES